MSDDDETTTIEVYRSDLSGRRLGTFSEPGDRGKKDELRRALDLLDRADDAGLLDELEREPATPTEQRAARAEETPGQIPLEESADVERPHYLEADGPRFDVSDEEEAQAAETVEALVGDVEADDDTTDDGSAGLTPEELLAEWRPGQSPHGREQRREIGLAALNWLRDVGGPRSATDFKNELYPDHHLDHGRDAWWRRTVRPALQEAEEAGAVEYSHGRHEYRWTDPQ